MWGINEQLLKTSRVWRVYSVTGFDFREKYRASLGPIGAATLPSVSYLATIQCKKNEADYFSRNFVCILLATTRHMVSFMDFFSFSGKFPDLNFAPYVLYIYSCYEIRTWHKQWAWVTCSLPYRLASFATRLTSLCLCMCIIARELNPLSVMVLCKVVFSLFMLLKLVQDKYIKNRTGAKPGLKSQQRSVLVCTVGSISLHPIKG